MYKIKYEKVVLKEFKKLKNQTKLLYKISNILEDIAINPYSPNFKFERLKGDFSGYCSKRLDKKNRVIYKVLDEEIIVIIISILGHYE